MAQNKKQTNTATTKQSAVSVQPIGGQIVSKRKSDGTFGYALNLEIAGSKKTVDLDKLTAIQIAQQYGTTRSDGTVYATQTSTGSVVSLKHEFVANIVDQVLPSVDKKALLVDGNASTKTNNKNVDANGNTLTVNVVNTKVTDWQDTADAANSIAGKIDTSSQTSKQYIKTDTAKGGSGNGNGASNKGSGTGANSVSGGTGLGDGTGNGIGKGDGSGENTNIKGISDNIQGVDYKLNETMDAQQISVGDALDDSAAAALYAQGLADDSAINHIFKNDFYNNDPVPAWAFSVDFIPLCVNDQQFSKSFTIENVKTLTKAVLSISANEKTINTRSINYLGMQHPFFTKQQASHGDLRINFAEDENYTITNILKTVLKYASFVPNFPTNKVYVKRDNSDEIVSYAASDTISPRYKLNATDLSVTNIHLSSLIHEYKFVFDIILKLYRAEDTHIFADQYAPPGFIYHYHNCWLKNLTGIDLDYNNDSPIDRSAIFSYQYMSSEPYYIYAQRNSVNTEEEDSTTEVSKLVKDSEQYSKNSSNSFKGDTNEQLGKQLDNFLNDAKNSKLKYLFEK